MPGICGRCCQNVFAAEERLGLNQSWHVRCFTCANCNRTLDSFSLAENRELNEIYCKTCYRLKFSTPGYGYGPNEPTLVALPPPCEVPDKPLQKCGKINNNCDGTQTPLPSAAPSCSGPRKIKMKPMCNKNYELPRPFTAAPSGNCLRKDSSKGECESPGVETKSRNMFQPCKGKASNAYQRPSGCSATRRSVVSQNDRSSCLKCDCGPLALPRYPPKTPETHRMPLTANSFKKGFSSIDCRSGNNPCCPKNSTVKTSQTSKRKVVKQLGGGEPCKRCQRPVYWAEMKLGYHGTYHQECFTCCCCGKPLESTTVCENQSEIFCKGCYRRLFGTHGYGYGIGAGTLQTS